MARESFVQFRATDEEKAEWNEAAKIDDCDNLTQWIRKLMKDRMRQQDKKAKKAEP